MTGSAHEFDWHAVEKGHAKWALVTLMKDADFDVLEDVTNGLTDVKIEVFVNGNRVHAKEYMERLWEHVQLLANEKARGMVEDIAPLHELSDSVYQLQSTILRQMEDFAAQHGIDFPAKY